MGKVENAESDTLKGTTLKVYHFMFKEGKPVGSMMCKEDLD
ncbi:MAG: hypothetical protein ACUVQ8_08470 [Nitrososphaeria archaeon]